jgi:glycosyltransferase involved in cell wall biosynthesis
MTESKLVSCVVPVYNGQRYLAETLDSIFAQTHRPIEVIVVDDGSTDGSKDVVATFPQPIRYHYQPNAGPAAAINAGVRLARGEFMAFLGADDLWHPEKLSRQLARFDVRPELDFCVAHLENFWIEELREEAERYKEHRLARPIPGYTCATLLARRSLFEAIGLFRPELQHGQDLDWFLRAAEHGATMELLRDVLLHRRLHHDNRSRRLVESSRRTFLRIVKASLDRRRDGTAETGEAVPEYSFPTLSTTEGEGA